MRRARETDGGRRPTERDPHPHACTTLPSLLLLLPQALRRNLGDGATSRALCRPVCEGDTLSRGEGEEAGVKGTRVAAVAAMSFCLFFLCA